MTAWQICATRAAHSGEGEAEAEGGGARVADATDGHLFELLGTAVVLVVSLDHVVIQGRGACASYSGNGFHHAQHELNS